MIKLPTFKFLLIASRALESSEQTLFLRITFNRKKAEYSTGIKILPTDWNLIKQQVKAKHRESRVFNARLDDILHECKTIAIDLGDTISASNIKIRLSKPINREVDFYAYYAIFRDELKANGYYDDLRVSRVIEKKLKDFTKSDSLPFTQITVEFLESFKRYLFNVVGNSQNTVHKEFSKFKRLITRAVKEGIITVNPFIHFQPIKKAKTEKARLSYAQIQAIEALKLKNDTTLCLARDAFLFSFYCAGIRFGDVAMLKWENVVDGRLKYSMRKTAGFKSILLLPQALEILSHYQKEALKFSREGFIFPLLDTKYTYEDEYATKQKINSKNTATNKNLKKIALLAGIQENVSFHVSRHSWADYARSKGMGIFDISKALGHSEIATTQIYLKSFDENSLDDSMSKLFN